MPACAGTLGPWSGILVGLAGPETVRTFGASRVCPLIRVARGKRQTDVCTIAATLSRKITPVLQPGRGLHS